MLKWSVRISFIVALYFLIRLQLIASQTVEVQYDILYAAFNQSRNTYQVQVVNAVSGEVTEIATVGDYGGDAGWSPDGRFIYLVDTMQSDARSLTLVNMETGNRQRVTDHFPPGSCSSPLWWSPDGHYLAYLGYDNRQFTITILDTDDDSIQQLPYEGETSIYEASWSAGGRYFAYGGRDVRIWDTSGDQVFSMLSTDPIQPARWSPVADQLAYTSDQTGAIVIFNVLDSSEQQFDAYYVDRWSPDGRYLLVVRNNVSTTFYQLLVADSVENTLRVLESNNVTWSADGQFLAYEAPDTGNISQQPAVIHEVSTGSNQQLAGTSIYPYSIQWSPVGHWLAFLQAPNQQHTFDGFWVVDLDGQQYRNFDIPIWDFVQDSPLRWSPDGRYLMVWTMDGLVLFDRQVWSLHRIPDSQEYVEAPRWSPDGRYLAFFATGGAYVTDIHDFQTHRLMNPSETNHRFLGWRGSSEHNSLIFCGEG